MYCDHPWLSLWTASTYLTQIMSTLCWSKVVVLIASSSSPLKRKVKIGHAFCEKETNNVTGTTRFLVLGFVTWCWSHQFCLLSINNGGFEKSLFHVNGIHLKECYFTPFMNLFMGRKKLCSLEFQFSNGFYWVFKHTNFNI